MKFSILTPSYNQGGFIEKNIISVMNQDWDQVEHIIIDGGSTDGTIGILRKYPHLKWVSEPDDGQADALNKGFSMATGDIVGWINSDDFYHEYIFSEVAACFGEGGVDWVIGKVTSVYPSSGIVLPRFSPAITYGNLLKDPNIIRQSPAFFKRDALAVVGGWNRKYHMAMDYDLWVRLSKKSRPKMVDRDWAFTTHHDRQKTSPGNTMTQISDIVDILRRENVPLVKAHAVTLKKYLYWLRENLKTGIAGSGSTHHMFS